MLLLPEPVTWALPTVEETDPEVHVTRRVQAPEAVAAVGSEIVIPVIASTLLVTTAPVAGPVMTGTVVPDVCEPETAPVDATGLAAVTAVTTVEVEDPAELRAITSTS
jgi:hypothetical protein